MWNALAEVALNRCCEEIACIAQTASGKIVCRVGGWDGAVEAAVYFERKGVVVFKFPSQALTGALFAVYDACATGPAARPWRQLTITIMGTKVSVDVLYPGQVDEDVLPDQAQRALVQEHFSASDWDDTRPDTID